MFWLIPLIIGTILLGVFLFFRVKEKRVTAVIIKGFVSLMFIITAVVAFLTSQNPKSLFIVFALIGLVFGLFGDILLDIKYISVNHELLFTKLGFIAFGLGHISYIAGLFVCFFNFNLSVLYIIIPVIIAIGAAAFTVLMEKFAPIRYKEMKIYVAIYAFILFFVTTIYLSAATQYGWHLTLLVIMAIAFIMFALSDLILNNTYFSTGFGTPVFIILNHVFYYVAQFAIAVALFYLI